MVSLIVVFYRGAVLVLIVKLSLYLTGTAFPLDVNDGPYQTERLKQTVRRWDIWIEPR